jgi:hypothetical protein
MAEKKPNEAAESEPTKKRCFVITPIGGLGSPERHHADWVLNGAIKPVFESRGYEVFRSDEIADPAMINDTVFNHIIDDEVCVADLTFLNPNVFYELGVRHALQKPVIHIADIGIRLPFDTAQHRAIMFDRTVFQSFEDLKLGLNRQLDAIEVPGFEVSNPLTHARGRQKIEASADPKDQIIGVLLARVSRLEMKSAQLDDFLPRSIASHTSELNIKLNIRGEKFEGSPPSMFSILMREYLARGKPQDLEPSLSAIWPALTSQEQTEVGAEFAGDLDAWGVILDLSHEYKDRQ